MKKRTLLVTIALGLGMAMVLAGVFRQPLYTAVEAAVDRLFPGQRAGADNLYTYTVETKRSGEVYVLVNVNFRDATARERYIQANKAKAEALVRKGGAAVRVTVTFAIPVPIPDFEALVKATGFEPEDYALEARDQQGGRVTHGTSAEYSKNGNLVDMERLKMGLEKTQSSINGAVVLVGNVPPTREGLGRLLSDTRVYIVDVVAAEVVDKVSKETGASPADIHIRVFSPYSFLVAPGP